MYVDMLAVSCYVMPCRMHLAVDEQLYYINLVLGQGFQPPSPFVRDISNNEYFIPNFCENLYNLFRCTSATPSEA